MKPVLQLVHAGYANPSEQVSHVSKLVVQKSQLAIQGRHEKGIAPV